MIRQEYIHFIKLALKPIDKTGQFHDEYIKIACDLVYSQSLAGVKDNLNSDIDIDLYSKEYTAQTVTLDATKGLYYSTLPAAIVPISGITSGLRSINTIQGLDIDMVPISELEMSYMDGSVTQMVDVTIGYWLQGTKIWYDESMTASIANAGVRMLLIPRFSEYARTDVINVPGGDLNFISQVIQLIAPTSPVDLKANNAG
jgi:hypothetical protein